MDTVFYTNFMLPPIFSFDYTLKQAKILLEAMKLLRKNCQNVDFSKYIEIIQNLVDEFANNTGGNEEFKLKIKSDLSIVPKNNNEEKIPNTINLEEEFNLKVKKGMSIEDVENTLEKEDFDEEMKDVKENVNKKKTKKDEKKLKIEERRKKKLEKLEGIKEEDKKEELEPDHVPEYGTHNGPKRRAARDLPIKAPDLDGEVKPPKDGIFKADIITKKNKKLRKEIEEIDE